MGFFLIVSGDENDRNAAARGSQVALELQSIHARHLYVHDETRGIEQLAGSQENFGRFKGGRSKAERFDQSCGGPADGLIVVNHRDQIPCHFEFSSELKVFSDGEGIYWALVDLWSQKARSG